MAGERHGRSMDAACYVCESAFINMKTYSRVHNSPPLAPILSKFSLVYTLIPYFINVLTDLRLSFPSDFFPSGYQIEHFMRYTFSSIRVCCIALLFHRSNNNLRAVQIMKLVISFLCACIASRHKN